MLPVIRQSESHSQARWSHATAIALNKMSANSPIEFQAKRMGAFMLDLVINYWGRLISALITGGPAGYYDEVRRAAEAKAAEEARRTGVRHG